jgi:hypothetical protein
MLRRHGLLSSGGIAGWAEDASLAYQKPEGRLKF